MVCVNDAGSNLVLFGFSSAYTLTLIRIILTVIIIIIEHLQCAADKMMTIQSHSVS